MRRSTRLVRITPARRATPSACGSRAVSITWVASASTTGWVRFRYSTPSGTGSSNRAEQDVVRGVDPLAEGAGHLGEVDPDLAVVLLGDDAPVEAERVRG